MLVVDIGIDMSGEFHHRSKTGEQKNRPFKGDSKRKALRQSRGTPLELLQIFPGQGDENK